MISVSALRLRATNFLCFSLILSGSTFSSSLILWSLQTFNMELIWSHHYKHSIWDKFYHTNFYDHYLHSIWTQFDLANMSVPKELECFLTHREDDPVNVYRITLPPEDPCSRIPSQHPYIKRLSKWTVIFHKYLYGYWICFSTIFISFNLCFFSGVEFQSHERSCNAEKPTTDGLSINLSLDNGTLLSSDVPVRLMDSTTEQGEENPI